MHSVIYTVGKTEKEGKKNSNNFKCAGLLAVFTPGGNSPESSRMESTELLFSLRHFVGGLMGYIAHPPLVSMTLKDRDPIVPESPSARPCRRKRNLLQGSRKQVHVASEATPVAYRAYRTLHRF